PYPYGEEEVSYDNTAQHVTLAATLTLPPGKKPFPAVWGTSRFWFSRTISRAKALPYCERTSVELAGPQETSPPRRLPILPPTRSPG
ncbi:MAG: hypothetical protein WBX03_12205, partial [Terriglobales bacterium]